MIYKVRLIAYYFLCTSGLIFIIGFSINMGLREPHTNDFRQYYGGALVAKSGHWELLYPEPIPGGTRNAGMDAIPLRGYREMATKAGVDAPQNYIQPPICALIYLPLALFDYATADWIWRLMAAASVWSIAIISGRIARTLAKTQIPSVSEFLTIGLICFTPGKSITPTQVGNVSPMVGLAIAAGSLFLIRREAPGAVASIGLAGAFKISPMILLITALQRCQRRPLLLSLFVGCSILFASLALTGLDVWRKFLFEIAPTLGRPWLPRDGKSDSTISLYGVAFLLSSSSPISRIAETSLKFLSLFGLVGLLSFVVIRRRAIQTEDRSLIAAVSALIVWPLISGPLFWGHYSYYFLFLTGWLITECRPEVGLRRLFPTFILFLMFGPWGRLPPFSRSQTWSSFVPLIVAILLLITSIVALLEVHSTPPGSAGRTRDVDSPNDPD